MKEDLVFRRLAYVMRSYVRSSWVKGIAVGIAIVLSFIVLVGVLRLALPPHPAEALRAELSEKFPGVEFEVDPNGSQVIVEWTDGPLINQVYPIARKHAKGDLVHYTWIEGIREREDFYL